MAEAGDISIAVQAAGAQSVQDDLEQVEEKVGDVGGEMEETAGGMQALNNRMSGLGKSIVAGLAVAATGLLSQVPVIREAMSGLGAVFSGLVFQIDRDLRPEVNGLSKDLFDLSQDVYEAEDSFEALKTILGESESAMDDLRKAVPEVVVDVSIDIGTDIGGQIQEELEKGITPGDIAGGLADTFTRGIARTDIGMWGRFGAEIGQRAMNALFDHFLTGEDRAEARRLSREFFNDPIQFAQKQFGILVDDASDWGSDIMGNLGESLRGAFSTVRKTINRIVDTLGRIPDAVDDALSNLDRLPGGGMSVLEGGIDTVSSGLDTVGDVFGGGGSNTSGGGFSADRGRDPININMDGRSLTRTDSRFRRNGTASRFRNG